MPTNDIEVFDHLTADERTPAEIDYLTYAIFAYKKSEWVDHFKNRNQGNPPTQADVDAWITELTDYDFRQMRNEAADFFHAAAAEHLHEYIEDQKKDAVDASILSEVKGTMTQVRSFTSPWKHLGIALLMAVMAPIVLAVVFTLLGVFDKTFPVHITITGVETPLAPVKPSSVGEGH
jgi:hypothetical protein